MDEDFECDWYLAGRFGKLSRTTWTRISQTRFTSRRGERDAYTGTYTTGFSGEVAFVPWELASFGLPTADPMAREMEEGGEGTFRRVRKDESVAESLRFEVAPDGKAVSVIWHDNTYRRVK